MDTIKKTRASKDQEHFRSNSHGNHPKLNGDNPAK